MVVNAFAARKISKVASQMRHVFGGGVVDRPAQGTVRGKKGQVAADAFDLAGQRTGTQPNVKCFLTFQAPQFTLNLGLAEHRQPKNQQCGEGQEEF